MKPHRSAERWFLQAQRDLDDAKYMAAGKRYNTACFLAQQAAEKALKAFLYHAGAEGVWRRSVGELCLDAAQKDVSFEMLRGYASALDKYYIPTRYPDALPGGIPADAFRDFDADSALELAFKIPDVVESKIV
jgi:HEPN domain-containing protein